MAEMCPICEDSGLRMVERNGARFAQQCECRVARKAEQLLELAQIPQRFAFCTLDDYVPGTNLSLQAALLQVRSFVKEYPIGIDGRGLLLTGPNGTGKTHLAVALARALAEKGVRCLFVTYGELLKQVQNTYNPAVQQTELDILRPVFDVDVLVIDELGSSKPSDWVWDTVAHILNTRYNDMRSTVITTNYANSRELLDGDVPNGSEKERDAWLAMYRETLGDRIGERMRSRLQEMCTVIEMTGPDFRQKVKRAAFGKRSQDTDKLPNNKSDDAAETIRRKLLSEQEDRSFRQMAESPAGGVRDEIGGEVLGKISGARSVALYRDKK